MQECGDDTQKQHMQVPNGTGYMHAERPPAGYYTFQKAKKNHNVCSQSQLLF
jgi:hypothetical protein